MWANLFVLSIILTCGIASATTDKVVCYYGSWSVYRQGNGRFTVEDINPALCTHAIYTFVGINGDGSIRILDSYNDIEIGGFRRFNALKNKNPKLKTLVAIGGWNEGSITFSQVAASQNLRTAFVNNALNFIKTYGFDGFDLDWEYPGQRGGSWNDKVNFAQLLKEFRIAFDKHGYILTAAVAAAAASVDLSYDVPALSENLDFINLMTYDLHGPWGEAGTGQNAPLYPSSNDVTTAAKELNVAACVQAWLQRGASPSKLVLGIGLYGRTFELAGPGNNGIGAPIVGPGNQGPYTGERGMLGYNEICELQRSGRWTVEWSDEQKVPYSYSGNQWVGYDNPRSVSIKVDFAKELKLAGLMVWSIETDDFRGICGNKYPLLTAINSGIEEGSSSQTTSKSTAAPSSGYPSPSTTTVSSGTTSGGNSKFLCEKSGYFRDPVDCSTFYYCMEYNGDFIKYIFHCKSGLAYDPEKGACDYEENVQC